MYRLATSFGVSIHAPFPQGLSVAPKKFLLYLSFFVMTLMAGVQEHTLKARSVYDVNQDDQMTVQDVPALANLKAKVNSCSSSGGGGSAADSHEYVDLGLSVLWATCNVGAEKPEDHGLYFAWGETTGYGPGTADGKSGTTTDGRSFDWEDYKWMDHSINASTGCLKYTFADNQTSGKWYSGSTYVGTTVDGNTYKTLTQLEAADDAATANWVGNWRMPTKAEQDELCNTSNCNWEWTTVNGVNGYKVTSKKAGYEGNYIFLPAAGFRRNSDLNDVGSGGGYWSSELNTFYSNGAYGRYFDSSCEDWDYGNRYYGQSVRPVCPKN